MDALRYFVVNLMGGWGEKGEGGSEGERDIMNVLSTTPCTLPYSSPWLRYLVWEKNCRGKLLHYRL